MSPQDLKKSLWFQKDQMHVIAPGRVSTCRSKNAKGEWVEKVYDYVIACNSLKRKDFTDECGGSFRIEASQGGYFCEERRGRNGTRRNCRRRFLDTVEPGKSTKEKGREEGEEDEGGEERRTRDQVIKEVIASIQKKTTEEEESWREREQMAAQWDEQQKLEEILEQRRMEGSPGQFEVVRRAPELVVHERMSQGKG